jgi:hypothetical protein
MQPRINLFSLSGYITFMKMFPPKRADYQLMARLGMSIGCGPEKVALIGISCFGESAEYIEKNIQPRDYIIISGRFGGMTQAQRERVDKNGNKPTQLFYLLLETIQPISRNKLPHPAKTEHIPLSRGGRPQGQGTLSVGVSGAPVRPELADDYLKDT